ncbi:exonuclease SbcC [Desulfotomaculum arcticum]|uniref:Nuclease SbcCD subunit C n=1 Tax=Desulfotruncus arcticus DSM 17038 TaxID=1121424 RepID=A0A1I2QKP9_9FIRM|nr:SMC family ATPase [Desulfotruncus arcticus]SFG28540.1 exonuclease SbcC [Desulfotomaculum arcticum] [Desulfotruncus arcticus DSM 17038]
MRPLKLSMTAFGPYAATQVLDFSELGNRSFFLIHGPTGSGKTTILDAMCYALYGDTSGALRDGKQMRSDHAGLATETEVVFDFAVGSQHYCIHRHPEQERLKKRGEGTTNMPAGAELWRSNELPEGKNSLIASGTGKVTEAVEKLLGFKSDQFRQVVMLPQGEFRKLLIADSKERQIILEALFRTEFYRQVEEFLKNEAKQLKNDYDHLTDQKNWVLQQAGVQSAQELLELHQRHLIALEEALKQLAAGKAAAARAQEQLSAGIQTRDKLNEKKAAHQAWAAIDAGKEDIEAAKKDLAAARRALTLAEAENSFKIRRAEAAAAEKAYQQKLAGKKQTLLAMDKAREKAAAEKEKEPEREAVRREANRLEDLKQKVIGLQTAKTAETEAQLKLRAAEKRLNQNKEEESTLKTDIEAKTKDRDAAQSLAARSEGLEAAYREAERTVRQKQALIALHGEEAQLQKKYDHGHKIYQQTENNYLKIKKELTSLQEAWNKGQSAILAGGLVQGNPCPVCGSTEHPAPAWSDILLPSEKDLKNYQQNLAHLEAARDKMREQLSALEAQKREAAGRAGDLEKELGDQARIALAVIQKQALEAKNLWESALKAAETLKKINSALVELELRQKALTEKQAELQQELQQKSLLLESARTTVREREAEIPEQLRNPSDLRAALGTANKRLEQLTLAYETSRKNAENAGKALAQAETAEQAAREAFTAARIRARDEYNLFIERMLAAGFATTDQYIKARKTPGQIQLLEQQITEFGEKLRASRDRLERAAQAAEGLAEPELDELSAALTNAESARELAFKEYAGLQAQTGHEAEWLQTINNLDATITKLEKRYSVMGRLADVANGKNNYGITFQRFVLGALLDDVTVAATERLKLMSRGRYHLQRTLDRARRNAAGGLELEVFDAYTGVARSVATLSGGETFLASLSLALGLADVVQSYAGGIHLDTIFVDEGFGTLDTEALDMALRALVDLQKGGRLVGIISHVPELKERIDARLEVKPSEKGSVAKFIVA